MIEDSDEESIALVTSTLSPTTPQSFVTNAFAVPQERGFATGSPTVCEENYIIDFQLNALGDVLNEGTPINETVPFPGVTFKARRRSRNETDLFNDGIIYDTSFQSVEGNKLDDSPSQRNVLFIPGDTDSNDTNGSNGGGEIIASFERDVRLKSITLLDFERGAMLTLFDSGGEEIMRMVVGGNTETLVSAVLIDEPGVSTFTLEYVDSGALDDVNFMFPCEGP